MGRKKKQVKKILFLIHDLGQGGAEKVLVNLVNNMDYSKFDITVMTLFDVGVNRQFLSKDVKYKSVFKKMVPGNSHLMKLLCPQMLHKIFIKEHYDVEVAYLEGPCARIISGCREKGTKLVSWIHIEQKSQKRSTQGFRSFKEACKCYGRFEQVVGVSETVKKDFQSLIPLDTEVKVLYNTNESDNIIALSQEAVENNLFFNDEIKLVGVGKLLKSKGFNRILGIIKRLREAGYPVHLYILGIGSEEESLKRFVSENGMENYVDFLGYQTNPYKYVACCDLFVCASYAEGFSTAATEALILGIPVCTVEVSGMKEMLGKNNEYGVVTLNDDESLYEGIRQMISVPGVLLHYKKKAKIRGKSFSTEETVNAVEKMILSL